MKKKIKKEKIDNIVPQIDNTYILSFADKSVDPIFAIACLPEIPDHIITLKEIKKILKPNGFGKQS